MVSAGGQSGEAKAMPRVSTREVPCCRCELGDTAEPGWSSQLAALSGALHVFTFFMPDFLLCMNHF